MNSRKPPVPRWRWALWLTILAAQLLGEIINDLAAAVADPGAADETDVTDKP